jgi:chaperonin GroEL (HSP60 family)
MVLNANTKRETGKAAQLGNISAAKSVADIIRTTLGPRSMLKMLLDPMGGIVMTNDGNCILREVDVSHPAAKSMIELSRAQDEEVGDGTTSVIILSAFDLPSFLLLLLQLHLLTKLATHSLPTLLNPRIKIRRRDFGHGRAPVREKLSPHHYR